MNIEDFIYTAQAGVGWASKMVRLHHINNIKVFGDGKAAAAVYWTRENLRLDNQYRLDDDLATWSTGFKKVKGKWKFILLHRAVGQNMNKSISLLETSWESRHNSDVEARDYGKDDQSLGHKPTKLNPSVVNALTSRFDLVSMIYTGEKPHIDPEEYLKEVYAPGALCVAGRSADVVAPTTKLLLQ